VTVRFDGVTGGLRPIGGAPLAQSFGVDGNEVLGATVDGDTVTLRLARPAEPGQQLHHGYGNRPALGLIDEADMPIPVFGPLPLAR
jgi:hypothetical protein